MAAHNNGGSHPPAGRQITALLVDLDDTLYTNEEMPQLVREHIHSFTERYLGVHPDEVQAVTQDHYMRHGTTYAGLVAGGCKIDADEWHAHVHHQLPYQELLRPDPKVRAMLQSLPVRKWIFTNADRKHAQICLDLLGLSDLFEGVLCFETLMEEGGRRGLLTPSMPVLCKPHALAFKLALELVGASAEHTAFLDDSTRNIAAARAAGIYAVLVRGLTPALTHAVLVGRTGTDCGADLELPSVLDLRQALPELWARQPVQDHGAPVNPEGVEELGPQRIRQNSTFLPSLGAA